MTRCLAVCGAVLALWVAAPAAGAVTWSLQSVPPVLGTNGQFFSISCASSTACTAVGFYINSVGQQRPLAETWNGTSWTTHNVPMPAGVPYGYLRGVSCPAANVCTAVGGTGPSAFPNQPLAERWNGTSWSMQTVPTPVGDSDASLKAVSCPTVSGCTAVGAAKGPNHSVPVAEHWNGTSWAAQTAPDPAGSTNTALTGLSCTSGSACIAVGDYKTGGGILPTHTLAERWNGSSWTILATPNPAGSTVLGLGWVACSSSTACTAVGGYATTGNSPNKTLAERWNGTSWTIQSTPNGSGTSVLSGVSCPSATVCTAVGFPLGSSPVVERWNGTSWSLQTAQIPSGAAVTQLSSVSCPTVSGCMAVGGSAGGSSIPQSTLAEQWNGTSWSIQTTPGQSGALPGELKGVSCATASFCAAVGDYTRSTGQPKMLAEGWNGSTWSIQTITTPSTTFGGLDGVSCTSSTTCTAVGSYVNGTLTNVSLADRWNGAKWVQQSTPNPPQSSTTSLFSVSCASATSCMAVGRFFNTGSGHWETLAEQWNGTTWSITTTPDPASATFGTLNGVSCKSASACTAAGGYSTTSTSAADRLVAEQWNGTSWSIKTTPAPAGTTFATFTGVSCSVASACTAAGGYSTTGGATSPSAPLAERWNGATWAIQSTTNPTSTGFTGDSCSAATACSAVGGQFGGIFAEGWNGTTWTSQTVATPPGAGILSGASCTAATACTASGSDFSNYLAEQIFAQGAYVGSMTVPLAERDPASPSAPGHPGGVAAARAPSAHLSHVGGDRAAGLVAVYH